MNEIEKIKKEINNVSIYDFSTILNLSKKVDSIIENPSNKIKIAVLGSFSTQHFVSALKVMLASKKLNYEIYEAEYNSINAEVFNTNSKLYEFQPNIVLLMPYYKDIKEFPNLLDSNQEVDKWVENQISIYKAIWNNISKIKGCYILQTNFVIPIERQLGNLEENYYFSKQSFYKLLNMALLKERENYVRIVDLEYIASYIGKVNWFDFQNYYLNKAGINIKYIGIVANQIAELINIYKGNIKKCLVLDLDNTIWGGVVADEGYEGITLDVNNAIGEAYVAFQSYVLDLKRRGVILAVCSKNDYDIAIEPFDKNPFMVLKKEDIACFVANWNDKATNIRYIAKTLNIGLDSIVFVDDNPAERAIVKEYLPEVTVVDIPEDVSEYIKTFEELSLFEWLQITSEDLERTKSYENDKKRKELENTFLDYNEYLKSLEMEVKIEEVNESNFERFVQLLNKSNQFNLRTKRYQENNIKEMLNNKNYIMKCVSLKDKFGNYGIISLIILKKIDKELFIDSWVMSCRVLKRGIEDVVMKEICNTAVKKGCTKIIGEFIPTAKNKMVENLYNDYKFIKCSDYESDKVEGVLYYRENFEFESDFIKNIKIV